MDHNNDELVQEFLLEAGETVELLSFQLIELEKRPEDTELLNGIFRGFHTLKGSAGFLGFDDLVLVCHLAENLFDVLKKQPDQMTSDLMDCALELLNTVMHQLDAITELRELPKLSSALVNKVDGLLSAKNSDPLFGVPVDLELTTGKDSIYQHDDFISDEEFEQLVDIYQQEKKIKAADDAQMPIEAQCLTLDEQVAGHQADGPSNKVTDNSSEMENTLAEVKPDLSIKSIAHVDELPKTKFSSDISVRVDIYVLDEIMNMVGELVLIRNRLLNHKMEAISAEITKYLNGLDILTSDLHAAVMKTRMQPIKKIFNRFPRQVRDLARSLGKDIEVSIFGENTELDKNLVESLSEPMVHLIRNAADHGIESPEDRIKAGKSPTGLITLSASQEGEFIKISIADDGKGMSSKHLKTVALKRHLIDAETASQLTEQDIFNLIFLPGFSSSETVSDISGRGVGMDSVKTTIKALNGSVFVESTLGVGSEFTIKVPITLAIIPTLMVTVQAHTLAIPLENIYEIYQFDEVALHSVGGKIYFIHREQSIPIIFLNDWISKKVHKDHDKAVGQFIIVAKVAHKQIGFVVDSLLGQEEVVVKPLGKMLEGIAGIAGVTIASDGEIALILDLSDLIKNTSTFANHLKSEDI